MLKYIALIPHSPALVPQISKQKSSEFAKLRQKIRNITADFYSLAVQSVVIITPPLRNNSPVSLNIGPNLSTDLDKYGYYQRGRPYACDLELACAISAINDWHSPIKIYNNDSLDQY